MNRELNEVKLLIESNHYSHCYLHMFDGAYEVYFCDHESQEGIQDKLVSRAGTPRTYKSVDRALEALEELGWLGSVTVERSFSNRKLGVKVVE